MSFQEYPKHMSHPAFKPAVVVKWDPKIKDPKDQQQGSPIKFPPVIVHNLDQEQEYASKGYKPNGVADPEAYRRAMTGNTTKTDDSNKKYPKWLYKADSAKEEGYAGKVVNTKDEELALGKGWYDHPDKAKEAGESAPPEPIQARSAAPAEAPAPAGEKGGARTGKARVKKAVKKAKARAEARA